MAGFHNPFGKLLMIIQGVKAGKHLSCRGIPVVVKTRDSVIEIGDNCMICSGFLSNLIGINHRSILLARNGGRIQIGNDVGLSGVTIYSREEITIGDKTLIGANTKILDTDFHPVDPDIRRQTPNEHMKNKPVHIGENVFIGCNCLILKGVTIGDDAVIGAGSVVTRDVPAGAIAAGNPATVIRRGVEEGATEYVR